MVHLEKLIDKMIARVKEHDLLNTYSILVGTAPAVDCTWIQGKRVYRWMPIAQTGLIPNDLVVLAPCPDNFRTGDVVEFHGHLDTMDITEHPVRLHFKAPSDVAAPSVSQAEGHS
ncbi:hypothetical protein QMG61_10665 [Cryobacterium sp. PH31-AA6]|uniref:hypothetical protein n=1 Tax=Cryobacterium sp. PH31-AA6 TaxID=3046205 RepID=UPI0024BA7A62|nr:hypothetical protein [Cryobacterium sp. PH31-AA6]MDJ0324227.1 hypothetical protein [Cryobacterium sp. PH31-AA6]